MDTFEWGDRLPTLLARRIALRPVGRADLADLLAVFSDEEAMGRWNPMRSIADAEEFVRKSDLGFERRLLFRWGIADRDSDRIIGSCGLFFIDTPHRRGEIGFALIPSLWGQGLATEAVGTLVGFTFGQAGLHRVEAFTRPDNGRAIRLLKRIGFQQEGCLRQRYHVGGAAVDALAFGLLRSEWTGGSA